MNHWPRRGDIYYALRAEPQDGANLDPVIGHEQAGRRPVLIIQNDIGNRYAPTVIIAALSSSSLPKRRYPTSVRVSAGTNGLTRDSDVRLDQLRTIDKRRLQNYVGHFDDEIMRQVDVAIEISLELRPL